MRGKRRAGAVVAALALSATTAGPARAWVHTLAGSRSSADTISLAAATPDGDLVTLGCPQGLVRLDGRTGRTRWQRDAAPDARWCPAGPGVGALVVAPDGTVVVASGATVTAYDGTDASVRWTHFVDGANDDDPGFLVAAAVDSGGDVVVAGQLDQGGDEDTTDFNFLVEKLARTDGHVVWRRLLDGSPRPLPPDCDGGCDNPGYPEDYATTVAVRDDGLVIAGGAIERGTPHVAVVAFDGASGVEAWRWESATTGTARAVAVDADGVVAAGDLDGSAAVVALGPDGTPRWQASLPSHDGDAWHAIALAGGVLVVGRAGGHAAVAGYDGSGALRWRRDEIDAGDGIALLPAADGPLALFALDAPTADLLGRWRVCALDADGATRWSVDPADGRPVALAMAARDLFVAGTTETPATFRDGTVIALDARDGTKGWRRDFDTAPHTPGSAEAIAVTPKGDVVAAGYVENSDTRFDFTVAALAPHTGRVRWQRELDGLFYGEHRYDVAHAVSVDAHGDVLAGGSIVDPFTIVKLDGSTGGERWRAQPDPPYASGLLAALAVDGRGDVVAAGDLEYLLEVHKHDGATGDIRWTRSIGSAFADAAANDVAVTTGGDVLVAGYTPDALHRSEARVMLLRSDTGDDVWTRVLGAGVARAVVASADAAVASAQIAAGPTGQHVGVIVSLDLATGETRWRSEVPSGQHQSVALDVRGDVVGCIDSVAAPGAIARKLDAETGDTRWERSIPAAFPYWSPGIVCSVTDAGDVAVVVPRATPDGKTLVAMLLDGGSGAPLWQRTLRDDLLPWDLATDRMGNLFVASERDAVDGFTVVGFGATSGSARPRRRPHALRAKR